ncbi:hypothetical protein [Leptolyngbya phage Lbo-JY46]
MPKKFSTTVEEWRPVKKYKGWYEVSSFGRVRSLPRYYTHKKNKVYHPGGLLGLQSHHQYYYVFLSKNGVRTKYYVHTLVLEAFKRCRLKTDKRLCCNHKDGNKLNNHVNNLEWSNYSLNGLHAYATGLKERVTPVKAWKPGEDHPNSRFTNKERVELCEEFRKSGMGQRKFAEKKGISYNGFRQIYAKEKLWREIIAQKEGKLTSL